MDEVIQILEELQKNELDSTINGLDYEKYVANKFSSIPGYKLVSNKEWKSNYKEYRTSYLKSDYDKVHNFQNLTVASGNQDDKLIIVQPNGSQQCPDILFIRDKIGFFIEVKTISSNIYTTPAWNSGKPRHGGFYIFKNSAAKKVTFFLGKDVMNEETHEVFRRYNEALKKVDKDFEHFFLSIGTWSSGNRTIHHDKNQYFSPYEQSFRESNVKNFLLSL